MNGTRRVGPVSSVLQTVFEEIKLAVTSTNPSWTATRLRASDAILAAFIS